MKMDLTVNGKLVYDMADGYKANYTFISEDKRTMFSALSKDANEFDFGDIVTAEITKKGEN